MLTISSSPHVNGKQTTQNIMFGVIIALLPALMVAVIFFGIGAIKVTVAAVAACVLFEYLIQKYMMKSSVVITDGSAALSGLLLAFNLPSNLPIWMVVVGSLVTIGIAKMSFGGLGKNPFNPALVGRVFLLVSFPVHMTSWPVPKWLDFSFADSATGATALSVLKEGLANGQSVGEMQKLMELPSHVSLFLGQVGGSLGEVSAVALLLGGIYLLYKEIITWHIPVSFLATIIVVAGAFWLFDSQQYADPIFHIVSGGIMLGAIFMATDMVTSPMTPKGQIIFGIGCGLLTVIIRMYGGYPEGVSFAILIMNACVPLIDKMAPAKRFGVK